MVLPLKKKSIKDIDVSGKRVLVRVDFNVPLDKRLNITDDTRLKASLPTIKYLLKRNSKVILISHLGRPKGKIKDNLRMNPVARRLEELLKRKVLKADDCIGEEVKTTIKGLKKGELLLLENVRFYKEEEENNPSFARSLSSLADIYVNDAFGTAHRAHASTVGVTKFLPALAGLLVQKELEIMGKALTRPKRPFLAILGGAKVSDKLGVIKNLESKADSLLIGGGMAYTFLKAKGFEVGKSLLEVGKLNLARELMEEAKDKRIIFELPDDTVIANRFAEDAQTKIVETSAIPPGWMGLDIGPKTRERFKQVISQAKTIFWNGPLGVFEMEPFAQGTKDIAQALAESKATTIIGGGDLAAAVEQMGLTSQMTHISTGGGASLEFMEGKDLPGIAALSNGVNSSRQALK